MDEPRAYTAEEVHERLLAHARTMALYWATLPDRDPATGHPLSIRDRCEGVAFSLLVMLDGDSMVLPRVRLALDPHPEDQEFLKGEGENWFEPGQEIEGPFHEFFYKRA